MKKYPSPKDSRRQGKAGREGEEEGGWRKALGGNPTSRNETREGVQRTAVEQEKARRNRQQEYALKAQGKKGMSQKIIYKGSGKLAACWEALV